MQIQSDGNTEKARELARRYLELTPKSGPRGRITREMKIAHKKQLDLLNQIGGLLRMDAVSAARWVENFRDQANG